MWSGIVAARVSQTLGTSSPPRPPARPPHGYRSKEHGAIPTQRAAGSRLPQVEAKGSVPTAATNCCVSVTLAVQCTFMNYAHRQIQTKMEEGVLPWVPPIRVSV